MPPRDRDLIWLPLTEDECRMLQSYREARARGDLAPKGELAQELMVLMFRERYARVIPPAPESTP